MRLKPNLRVALVRAACLTFATYVAWPLFDMTPPRNPPELLAPTAQRVRMHAPGRQRVQAAKRETVIIKSEKAPAKKLVVKEQKAVSPPPAPVKPVIEPPPAVVPQPVQVTQLPPLVFEQPGLPQNAELPPIPPDVLPAPVHFTDKPGGSVVILGVKLDSNNVAVMTDILVASNTPLNDLALAMTTRGVKWTDVDPPIPPGEYRWVELRLDYDSGNKDTILP